MGVRFVILSVVFVSFTLHCDAQDIEYCELLPGFEGATVGELGRISLTLGLSARKAELRSECPGGVTFDGESQPATTVLSACQNTDNTSQLRLLYNLTESCFDEVRRRTIREGTLLDVGIGIANGSQFVQFVDQLSSLDDLNNTIANPVTFRTSSLQNNAQYCTSLNDSYIPVDAEVVNNLITLGTTLYKVSLQTFCPFGIRLEDSLAPARMLQQACQFEGFEDEYRLKITSVGFCIVRGSFAFGQGYNRNDTYEVLVTRRPPSAFWIFFENSTYSLDNPAFPGVAPITNATIPQIPADVDIPSEILDLLGVNGTDRAPESTPTLPFTPTPSGGDSTPTPSGGDSTPTPSGGDSTPTSTLTPDEILDAIIDGRDTSTDEVKNRVIQEIAEDALNDDDSDLLAKSFQATTVVNGNSSSLFEFLGPELRDGNNAQIAGRALETGVEQGISDSMAEGIADTFQNNPEDGDQWMRAISTSIRRNSCDPIAQLLNGVRELARGGVIEDDFVAAVSARNTTLLACLTNCSVLPGFVPGGPITNRLEFQLQIGVSRIYEDSLQPQCLGEGGPVVTQPEAEQDRLLVICNSENDPEIQRIFLEVDVDCPDQTNAVVESLEVIELAVSGNQVTSADPLSKIELGQFES